MLRAHYPLRLHLATWFVALVLMAAGLVGAYNQWVMRAQVNLAARAQLQRVADSTANHLQQLEKPVASVLAVLAASELRMPGDEQDAPLRRGLHALLQAQPALAAAYVGDGSGRFYMLRALRNAQERQAAGAPEGAAFVLQHIQERGPTPKARFTFFDAELRTLRIDNHPEYAQRFDPRDRPWYHQALQRSGLQRTSPYVFFSSQQPGLTLAQRSQDDPELVLAADLTLASLSQQLRSQALTDSHALLLVNAQHETIAASREGLQPSDFDAAVRGQRAAWLGIDLRLDKDLRLLTQLPEAELQREARDAISRSALITLALVLLALPFTWWLARRLTKSLQALSAQAMAIKRFQFDEPASVPTHISEVVKLGEAISSMRRTIRRFVEVTGALAEETDFERLQTQLLVSTLPAVDCAAGVLYLLDGDRLHARSTVRADTQPVLEPTMPVGDDCAVGLISQALRNETTLGGTLDPADWTALGLGPLAAELKLGGAIAVPLHNRRRERLGLLLLMCESQPLSSRVSFAQAVAHAAATAIETRELIQAQRALFQAFIELIAAAIDAKSPYTGGHCARVPELTKMLAQAACDAREGPFASFELDDQQWEALHVGAWLHDCGKVTTPDYVVDKATKLETLYNRLHEVRMRFEVLKRDAHIAHLERVMAGGNAAASLAQRDAEQALLDDEFAFVARCNLGGEAMSEGDRSRVRGIAQRRWLRTLDDRLGLSHEEAQRLASTAAPALPTWEPLLADKPEHRIERAHPGEPALQPDNPWGFQLQVPALLYNRGEVYNLTVGRGTLSAEERFKINEHIVQTIVMLDKLPYPRHLRDVPEIAGGHHEKMDGTGYPKRLRREQMSVPARIMAIADVFEALTAADRPYKSAMPLSTALGIMLEMARNQHIDAELFALFLRSGVANAYAKRHLSPEQHDAPDIDALLQALAAA